MPQASSGRHQRHRLNRGGDRRLNCALYNIAINRSRTNPETRAYIERRRAQHKTDREIRRCLKRYLARRLFHLMNDHTNPLIHTA
jgi:transposase